MHKRLHTNITINCECNLTKSSLIVGIDVGSTTVKATVVHPGTLDILWSDYRRHHTHQPETVAEFLKQIATVFPATPESAMRVFITGSGAKPLVEPLGACFVQEVNAITLAVERLHPEARSVVELGGQDAKIILFRENEATGELQAQASMNDKCASGTGATIDKCMTKVGLTSGEVASIPFDSGRLHHIAAKCGVFAEMDVVSLVKAGVPAGEILCSLADAIVKQNLSVLARGNTLRPGVLLLGGPNHYLPFLRECWRLRIQETWVERDLTPPATIIGEDLIRVPERAVLYAAYGAVLFGLQEPAEAGHFRGLEALDNHIRHGRRARLGENTGPPLVQDELERTAFTRAYHIPSFRPAPYPRDRKVCAALGVDGGSTSTKAVLLGDDGTVLDKAYRLSEGNPIKDVRHLLDELRRRVSSRGAHLEITAFGATGYAADVLERALRADINVVETVAHMKSAVALCGEADVICDIGGQDIKVLFLRGGELHNFRLNNQCSAGNGMLLQAMADQFGVPVRDFADHAFRASLSARFSYGCAVFLDSDRVNFQKEGFTREELMAGLAMVLPKNIWQYVVQIPRMAELGRRYILQGGTQYNLAAVKAQVDYIRHRVPDADIRLHPHPGEAGAIGAAMEARREVGARGHSIFIGLDQAIDIEYTTHADEGTRCTFCPNRCLRTFINTRTPDGATAQYISGFSCERGTVADVKALKALHRRRREQAKRCPNLAAYEAKHLFIHTYTPEPLPEPGTSIDTVAVHRNWRGRIRRIPKRRPLRRSTAQDAERRARLRIGLPRCLDMWSNAPFWRAYFETLGIARRSLVWSDESGEKMFAEGGKYGAVDPCYPAKVVQAHIHNLLFKHHREGKRLNYIFFPTIPQHPSWLERTPDATACPVVTGTPNVIKAAFTKEIDYFARARIEYLDAAVCLGEPVLARHQLFTVWGPRLGITEDESDFAFVQGNKAMSAFDADLQMRGRAVLEEAERGHRLALLLLGRPYHLDPGMNHGVTEDFQALGHPVLTLRSIPKDTTWLTRFFEDDLAAGRVVSPLEVGDVWPEHSNSNSAQKVWGAKFAARHPNVAILDLSSFKCGHDAPTYGIVERIVATAGIPYMALHDIDANNPTGAIKIRVKTYAYTLRRREEKLRERAELEAGLQDRLAAKRRELTAARKTASQSHLCRPSLAVPSPAGSGAGNAGRMGGNQAVPGALVPQPAET